MRIRVIFAGRVQGVGFRATARDIAQRHPMTGFVQNQPDGSVLLEAQGEPAAVDNYLSELRQTMARNIKTEAALPMNDQPTELSFAVKR